MNQVPLAVASTGARARPRTAVHGTRYPRSSQASPPTASSPVAARWWPSRASRAPSTLLAATKVRKPKRRVGEIAADLRGVADDAPRVQSDEEEVGGGGDHQQRGGQRAHVVVADTGRDDAGGHHEREVARVEGANAVARCAAPGRLVAA